MSNALVVTRQHLFTIPGFSRRQGFCRSGARAWFERYQLDWSAFMREGIAAETLAATGDGLALALVAWARECQDSNTGEQDGR